MRAEARQRSSAEPGSAPSSKLVRKIALLVGTDDLSFSHFGALMSVLHNVAREVIVIIADGPRRQDFEAVGARVIAFDCRAAFGKPAHEAVKAWQLARILEAESADAIHARGVRAALLCGLAVRLIGGSRTMVHLPDLAALEFAAGRAPWLYGRSPARRIAALVGQPSTFLLVESPADLAELRGQGIDPGSRAAVVGGPGIDPDAYPLLPPAHGDIPVTACPLPLTVSSGVDVLMGAFDRVWARGVRMSLELVGPRAEGRTAIPSNEIARWRSHPGVRRIEPVADVREVWRGAEVCVLPSVKREGLLAVLLEAAAGGRALIVSHGADGGFVRHEVEGLVVRAGDTAALSEALERLARDSDLRRRLGNAARLRLLQGYTRAHVQQTLKSAYLALLDARTTQRRAP